MTGSGASNAAAAGLDKLDSRGQPNGHSVTTINNGTSTAAPIPTNNVSNLANHLAGMSVKGSVKLEGNLINNGHHHHIDSNKMTAAADQQRREEKSDGEKPAAAAAQPVVRAKPKDLDGYVGFANLPNQVYRKAVKRGFDFTLMVVGKYERASKRPIPMGCYGPIRKVAEHCLFMNNYTCIVVVDVVTELINSSIMVVVAACR